MAFETFRDYFENGLHPSFNATYYLMARGVNNQKQLNELVLKLSDIRERALVAHIIAQTSVLSIIDRSQTNPDSKGRTAVTLADGEIGTTTDTQVCQGGARSTDHGTITITTTQTRIGDDTHDLEGGEAKLQTQYAQTHDLGATAATPADTVQEIAQNDLVRYKKESPSARIDRHPQTHQDDAMGLTAQRAL